VNSINRNKIKSIGGVNVNRIGKFNNKSVIIPVELGRVLFTWGLNDNGQLGLGDVVHRSSPVQVGALTNWASVACGATHTLAINAAGQLFAWGRNNSGRLGLGDIVSRSSPVQVGPIYDWDKISAGGSHSIGVVKV